VQLQRDVPLDELNTLRLPARARYYVRAERPETVAEACEFARRQGLPLWVLGGGSNVVLRGDLPGLVLHMALSGIQPRIEGQRLRLRVAAGESWPDLVEHCLAHHWYGLENLSLIPGTAGAAPIQNIGAYGVELARHLHSVEGWNRPQRRWQTLTAAECRLGYRDSLFKHALRDRFVITAIVLTLSRRFEPCLDYPVLAEQLAGADRPLTPRQVADAVIAIRSRRLPDPEKLANAGSFFKNPVLDSGQYQALCQRLGHESIPAFAQKNGIKVPAAWLLDQAGWKGRRLGPVGMHDRQPLVLVNHGGARGADVLALAEAVCRDIRRRFQVELEMEPRLLPRGEEWVDPEQGDSINRL